MSTINIKRTHSLPTEYQSSTIYISKSPDNPELVDLVFVGNDTADVRRAVNIPDVQAEIEKALRDWVPQRSFNADRFTEPFRFTLTGDITGEVTITGDLDVSMETTIEGSGGTGNGQKHQPGTLLFEQSFELGSNLIDGPIAGQDVGYSIIPDMQWRGNSSGNIVNGELFPDPEEELGTVTVAIAQWNNGDYSRFTDTPFRIEGPYEVVVRMRTILEEPVPEPDGTILSFRIGGHAEFEVLESSSAPWGYVSVTGHNFEEVMPRIYSEAEVTVRVYPTVQRISFYYDGIDQVFVTKKITGDPINWGGLRILVGKDYRLQSVSVTAL